MKKISAIISLCLACIAAFAQTADIEVSYNYRHFHRRGSEQNHQMILLANASHSKFYNPTTDYLDSLESTPEGTDTYNQMKMAAFASGNMKDVPKRSVPMYVFKHKDGVFDVYDGNIASMYHYTEPYEVQEWTVCDSTKTFSATTASWLQPTTTADTGVYGSHPTSPYRTAHGNCQGCPD